MLNLEDPTSIREELKNLTLLQAFIEVVLVKIPQYKVNIPSELGILDKLNLTQDNSLLEYIARSARAEKSQIISAVQNLSEREKPSALLIYKPSSFLLAVYQSQWSKQYLDDALNKYLNQLFKSPRFDIGPPENPCCQLDEVLKELKEKSEQPKQLQTPDQIYQDLVEIVNSHLYTIAEKIDSCLSAIRETAGEIPVSKGMFFWPPQQKPSRVLLLLQEKLLPQIQNPTDSQKFRDGLTDIFGKNNPNPQSRNLRTAAGNRNKALQSLIQFDSTDKNSAKSIRATTESIRALWYCMHHDFVALMKSNKLHKVTVIKKAFSALHECINVRLVVQPGIAMAATVYHKNIVNAAQDFKDKLSKQAKLAEWCTFLESLANTQTIFDMCNLLSKTVLMPSTLLITEENESEDNRIIMVENLSGIEQSKPLKNFGLYSTPKMRSGLENNAFIESEIDIPQVNNSSYKGESKSQPNLT